MVIIRTRKKTVAELKLWYKDYSAREALAILAEDFGMGFKTFMWFGEVYTVERALTTIPDYLLDMYCGAFGIVRFMGGPLGKTKWYNGTVLTMLCDAALFEAYARSMTAEQRLRY
jgi:hypothetical protein